MKLVCLDVGRLLDRRHSGLSAAEGLRLEEHLATCADCRADANLLAGLSHLASAAHVPLSASAREGAIANALAAHARPQMARTVPPRRVGMFLMGAAAALALGVIALQRTSREAVAAPERVLSGEVQVAGSARAAGAVLGSDVQLHASEAAVVALAHARVELRAGSEARWDRSSRKLDLQRGSAVFEVDPTPHQSFTVQTKAFTVLVLGTRFEVTQDAVIVLSGRVSVQPTAASPDTRPVVLAAGSEQTRFEVSAHVTQAAEEHPQIGSPTAEAEPVRSRAADVARSSHGARASDRNGARVAPQQNPAPEARLKPARDPLETRDKHGDRLDANALLERARSELAARELTQARATLDLAKPLLRDAPQRAQALSLEAECELQARRFGAARDTYLQVARKYSGVPAAETALFAAARIEAEHGDPARAAELLRNYLRKHPQGSYVREAERRLQLLPKQATP